MALKRKATEAFSHTKGQLSAFAAAKIARQSKSSSSTPVPDSTPHLYDEKLATAVASSPYDEPGNDAISSADETTDLLAFRTPPPANVATQLSTYRANVPDKDNEDTLEIALQISETIACVGEYNVEVLSGIVSLYGALLRPASGRQRVYAPSTQALPRIQAKTETAVVRMISVKSSFTKLETLSPLFRNIGAVVSGGGRSFTVLRTSADDQVLQRSLTPLEVDGEAEAVVRRLSAHVAEDDKSGRILAIGAKSSGKSTFNRMLCNHILSSGSASKCLYLDLDPGQPEFGPPGQLSLVEVSRPILGPPFTHTSPARRGGVEHFQTIRSHTLAAMSFKDDPEHYKACVMDLVGNAHSDYPLIVNSCGWVSGLGASVLLDLVSELRVTELILLEPLDQIFTDSLRSKAPEANVHKVPRRAAQPSSRTPAETRAMQTMAYFHYCSPSGGNRALRYVSKPIDKIRPWIVDYSNTKTGILAILSYGQTPDPEFLLEVLEGSIVAINVLEEPSETPDTHDALTQSIERTPENLPFIVPSAQNISRTLDPSTSHFVSLALIRAIDTENQTLHLIIPLSEQEITEKLMGMKVVLVRGSFDPPEWAYLESLHENGESGAGERPWVSRRADVSIEGAVWRLRHPPVRGG